jgi:copper oxidase (laccase) domain-containing protein
MKKIYQIEELTRAGVKHRFFSKDYGNISYFYGEQDEVDKNRDKIAKEMEIDQSEFVEMEQVHGNNVVFIKNAESEHFLHKCDGIITNLKNTYLFLKSADCFPVIL